MHYDRRHGEKSNNKAMHSQLGPLCPISDVETLRQCSMETEGCGIVRISLHYIHRIWAPIDLIFRDVEERGRVFVVFWPAWFPV